MNIDLKLILPYVAIICSIGISWGMFTERLNAVEKKAASIDQMMVDIAVIKEKSMKIDDIEDKLIWIEEFLIKTSKDY